MTRIASISLGVIGLATAVAAGFVVTGWSAGVPLLFADTVDPLNDPADADADGISNGDERRLYNTNPYSSDTDSDGYLDRAEIDGGYDPLVAASDMLDVDGDGLTGADEAKYGTNPSIPDTDGDGTPDGVEIVQGSDPGRASIDSIPEYLGVNVPEERDPAFYPPIQPTDLQMIESVANASSLESFQQSLTPLLGGAQPTAEVVVRDIPITIGTRSDKAFVIAYFNTVALTFAQHSPVLTVEELSQLASSINLRDQQQRSDYANRSEAVLQAFQAIEVPNEPEIIAVHKETLQLLDVTNRMMQQLAQLDIESPDALPEMMRLLSHTQAVQSKLQSDLLPRIQGLADRYGYAIPTSLNSVLGN